MAQKAPKQSEPAFGTQKVVPAPKDDDWKNREQDGQNRLLQEGDFMDRSRLMENE